MSNSNVTQRTYLLQLHFQTIMEKTTAYEGKELLIESGTGDNWCRGCPHRDGSGSVCYRWENKGVQTGLGFKPVFGEFTGQRLVNSKTASLRWIWTAHLRVPSPPPLLFRGSELFFLWFLYTNRVHNGALGAPGKLNFTPFTLSTPLAHLHRGSATLSAIPNQLPWVEEAYKASPQWLCRGTKKGMLCSSWKDWK